MAFAKLTSHLNRSAMQNRHPTWMRWAEHDRTPSSKACLKQLASVLHKFSYHLQPVRLATPSILLMPKARRPEKAPAREAAQ